MAFAISLEMERCPDGVEVFFPAPPAALPQTRVKVPGANLTTGGGLLGNFGGSGSSGFVPKLPTTSASWFSPMPTPIPPRPLASAMSTASLTAPRVRYRTGARDLVRRRLDLLQKPLVEDFVRCEGQDQLTDFMSEHGIPDWKPADDSQLDMVEGFRGACAGVLSLYARGEIRKAAAILEPQRSYADLRPVLAFPRGSSSPVMVLKVFALKPFLCLEMGSIIAGGATVKNCLNCQQLFVVGPATGRRTTALYCTNRCRVAHQRSMTKETTRRQLAGDAKGRNASA